MKFPSAYTVISDEVSQDLAVVRAFVREPYETERFRDGNERLTRTALRGGRLMGLMFPTAMFVVNISSVAVVWFGANRVNTGEMRIGALIAFLQYLMQILMSVMLATYMAALVPRASVSAERIIEVLDTPSTIGAGTVGAGAMASGIAPVSAFTEQPSVQLKIGRAHV